MHDKIRKSNNPNLNIFSSDTQKIIDDKFDHTIEMYDDSDPECLMHDSLKSTSLSFAFSTSTSCSDFNAVNTKAYKEKYKTNKVFLNTKMNLIDKKIANVNYNATGPNLDNISIPTIGDNSTIGENTSLSSKN